MKYFKIFSIGCLILNMYLNSYAQTLNPIYNKVLADSLGADDYGMKSYVFVILKKGKSKIEDKTERSLLIKKHLDNINRLAGENLLLVAGPFGNNEMDYSGLFILNVKTVEEAQDICNSDPAVEAGIFDVILIPWYGSAGLGEYLKISGKLGKYKS